MATLTQGGGEISSQNKTLIAVVRTLDTFAGVSTYVVVAGIPALLWTLIVRDPRLLYRVGELGIWLGLTLAGMRPSDTVVAASSDIGPTVN